jgi:hypothetical protein
MMRAECIERLLDFADTASLRRRRSVRLPLRLDLGFGFSACLPVGVGGLSDTRRAP